MDSIDTQNQKESLVENKKNQMDKQIENFLQEFKALVVNEDKIRISIELMRTSLAQEGNPNFKLFWEARRNCLPVFKESLNPLVRTQFWAHYIELSDEARRLKIILDEQTAFTMEQIDLAINALEEDLKKYETLKNTTQDIEIPKECKSLGSKEDFYKGAQKELNLLNTFAARINSLRKEIIRISMRIKNKNKFFKRLSLTGDLVFPKRKTMIREMSESFTSDVKDFIEKHFEEGLDKKLPVFLLRDEIKGLQNFAKTITLNTRSFTSTRLKLSECWDRLREQEKDKRQDFVNKQQVSKENAKGIEEKIAEIAKVIKEDPSIEKGQKLENQILDEMRKTELRKEDIRILKQSLQNAMLPIEEKKRLGKELIQQEALKRKEQIEELKTQIIQLTQEAETHSVEDLTEKMEEFRRENDFEHRENVAAHQKMFGEFKKLHKQDEEQEKVTAGLTQRVTRLEAARI